MGKKNNLSETKRVQILIFSQRTVFSKKDLQKKSCCKTVVYKAIGRFKILVFTMTRKKVEDQENQAIMMTN